MPARLVLASQSPRRREILDRAGYRFTVRVPNVPEQHQAGETPEQYVRRLAHTKAAAVPVEPGEVVLGADTVVVVDGHILEKPSDAADAVRMLNMLGGREHSVVTGVCLRTADTSISIHAETRVRFVQMEPKDIEAYVASGEPLDKAGAYAIQGLASKFIDRIDGCYFNVVGLPIALVHRLLRDLNYNEAAG